MLLVENVPQPVRLIISGEAIARKSRLHLLTPRRIRRRRMTAVMSHWLVLEFLL
jgi:hypothetical protein